jgi:hypothetical protein
VTQLTIVPLHFPEVNRIRQLLRGIGEHPEMEVTGSTEDAKMFVFSTDTVGEYPIQPQHTELGAMASEVCGLMLNIIEHGTPLIEAILHYMRNGIGGEAEVTLSHNKNVWDTYDHTFTISDSTTRMIFTERARGDHRYSELVMICL